MWSDKMAFILSQLYNSSSSSSSSSSNVSHRADYLQLRVLDNTRPLDLYGSCSRWSSYIFSDVRSSSSFLNPLSITLISVVGSLDTGPTTYLCDNSQITVSISQYLSKTISTTTSSTTTTTSSPLRTSCGSHEWVVNWCSSSPSSSFPALCVDCDDPCATNSNSCSGGALNPCGPSTCGQGLNVLSIAYADKDTSPAITYITATAIESTSLTLEVRLDKRGYSYCAAFKHSTIPTTVVDIISQGFISLSNMLHVSLIFINGLLPSTSYRVYCVTRSTMGTVMTLADSMRSSQTMSTACCRMIDVAASMFYAPYGQVLPNLLTITVHDRPDVDMTIDVLLLNASRDDSMTPLPNTYFYPSRIHVLANQGFPSQYRVSLSPIPIGNYNYLLIASSDQYSVAYANDQRSLNIVSANAQLPLPVLFKAILSNDGSAVMLSFDADTNRGNLPTAFACSALFLFPCSGSSLTRCRWVDSRTVMIVASTSPSCLSIGDSITLIDDNSIKAACLYHPNCDSTLWHHALGKTVIIVAPVDPIIPSVVITTPDVVSDCSSFQLDVSTSSGHGARPWSSIDVSFTSDATTNIQSLNQALNNSYSSQYRSTPISSSLLENNRLYNFQVTLCNFMMQCGSAVKRILKSSVIAPSVFILGGSRQNIYTKNSISISSNAYLTRCDTSPTQLGLQYEWRISSSRGVRNTTLEYVAKKASKDPTKLKLPPFSLDPGSLYRIMLVVTDSSTFLSSSSEINIVVQSGNIVPVILLGLTRIIRVNDNLLIDASQSYDEDQPSTISQSSHPNLVFTWTCSVTAPTLANSCTEGSSSYITILESSDPAVYSFQSGTIESQLNVAVLVSDRSGSRSSSSVIAVTIKAPMYPTVSVDFHSSSTANAGQQYFNPNNSLQLTGVVNLPPSYNASAIWTVDGNSGFDLAQSTTSPLNIPLAASTDINTLHYIYLALSPNTLPAGQSLNLRLEVMLSNHIYRGTASIAIAVNSAPTSGTFQMAPYDGKELVDSFTFYADLWCDSDLPLQYQFYYLSNDGASILLWLRSAASSRSSFLPAGSSMQGFGVVTRCDIFDSLSASVSAFSRVIVRKSDLSTSTTPTSYEGFITDALSMQYSSSDYLKQSVALSAYLLNNVDCYSAPNCSLLHRSECYRTTNTCGSCISALFVGMDGDSNEPCVVMGANSLKSNAAILGPSSMDSTVTLQKTCTLNCSSRGKCIYVHADSGDDLSTCYIGSHDCIAVCVCDDMYFGSDYCSFTTEDFRLKQALRLNVLSAINRIMDIEDPDLQSIPGWIQLLRVSCQAADELSPQSASIVFDIVDKILHAGQSLDLSVSLLAPLLSAIDSASQTIASAQNSSRYNSYHHNSSMGENNATLISLDRSLDSFRRSIFAAMIPDEQPRSFILSNFRMLLSKLSVRSIHQQKQQQQRIQLSLPLSTNEALVGMRVAEVVLPMSSIDAMSDGGGDGSAVVALTSIRSQLFNSNRSSLLNNSQVLYSNPLTVEVKSDVSQLTIPDRLSVTLPTSTSLIVETERATNDQSIRYHDLSCSPADDNSTTSMTATCPDNSSLELRCDRRGANEKYILRKSCAVDRYAAICNPFRGVYPFSQADSGNCSILSLTDTNITCSCSFLLPHHQRSLQSSSSSSSESDYSYSLSYSSSIHRDGLTDSQTEIIPEQATSFSSTPDHSWAAVIFTSCILMTCIISISWASVMNVTVSKKVRNDFSLQLTELLLDSLDSIEKPLPQIFHSLPLIWRIAAEFRSHHPWLTLLYSSSAKPRVLMRRLSSLSLKIFALLFSNSIVYSIGYVHGDATIGLTIAIAAVQMVVLASFLYQICESLLVHSFAYLSSLTCHQCNNKSSNNINSINDYDENKLRNGNNKPSSVSPSPEGLMYSILPTGTPQVDEIVIPSVETVFRQFLRDLFQYWSSLPEREKIKFCGEIYRCYSSHV